MAKPLSCFLITITNGDQVEQKVVDENKFSIGRSIEATLAFSDPNISRIHLIVRNKGDSISIEDKDSANGTYVNSQRIDSNVQVNVELTDTIGFGKSSLQLQMQLIEKTFPREATKHPAVNAQGQKLMMQLIEGAHAEAARIIQHSQDQVAQVMQIAQEKAELQVTEAQTNRAEIIQSATNEAEEIVAEGRKKVSRIIQSAEIDAEEMKKALEADLAQEKIKRLAQINEEAANEIESNLKKAKENLEDSEKKSAEIIASSQLKADEIIKSHEEKALAISAGAQKAVDEAIEKNIIESRYKMEKEREELLKLARLEADQDISRKLRDLQFNWEKEKGDKVKAFEEDFTKRTDSLEAEITAKRIVFERDEADRKMTLARMSAEIAELSKTLDILRADKERVEPAVIVAKADLERATTECDKQRAIYKEHLDKANDEDSRYRLLKEEFSKVDQQLSSRRAEIDRMQELEKVHMAKLKDLDDAKYQAEKSLDEVNLRYNKAQSEYQKKSAEIEEALKFEKERMAKEKETFAYAIKLENEKLKRNFEDDIAKVRKEFNDLNLESTNVRDELFKRKTELTEAQSSLVALQPQYQSMKEELSQYFAKKADLENSIRLANEQKHESLRLYNESELKLNQAKLEIEKCNDQLKNVKQEIQSSSDLNANLTSEFKKLILDRDSIKSEYEKMQIQKSGFDREISTYSQKLEDLKKTVAGLEYQHSEKLAQLQDLERDYQTQRSNFKSKLEEDQRKIQKEAVQMTDEMQLAEVNRISRLKDDMLLELSSRKESIVKEAQRRVELELAKHIDKGYITSLSQSVQEAIRSSFEETTASIMTQGGAEASNPSSLKAKRKRDRVAMIAVGILMGLSIMPIYHELEKQINANSYKKMVADKMQKEKANYESRRFNPPKVDEFQESYTDSVIYTRGFTEKYSDDGYQRKLNNAVIDYFLDKWRVEEEVSIRATAVVYALVTSLEERRKNIHPDFVEENVDKMREVEVATNKRLEEILGSKVRVEAFKKFEKRFFEKESYNRVPAARDSE